MRYPVDLVLLAQSDATSDEQLREALIAAAKDMCRLIDAVKKAADDLYDMGKANRAYLLRQLIA